MTDSRRVGPGGWARLCAEGRHGSTSRSTPVSTPDIEGFVAAMGEKLLPWD